MTAHRCEQGVPFSTRQLEAEVICCGARAECVNEKSLSDNVIAGVRPSRITRAGSDHEHCLHDMGYPVDAGKHVKETLAKDGSWMIVEPFAHDNLKDNLNPVGSIFYHASAFICTPASLSQEVGLGLGAQAGESKLRQVATEAGFKRFRRATETPFNMIFDVHM